MTSKFETDLASELNSFSQFTGDPEFDKLISDAEIKFPEIRTVPREVKSFVLYLMLSGKKDLLNSVISDINSVLFKRYVPPIEEFLTPK